MAHVTRMKGSAKGLYFESDDTYTYIEVEDGYLFDVHKLEYEYAPDAQHFHDEEFVCPMEYLV